MEYPRRRTVILERPSFPAELYGQADRRLLAGAFGTQVVEGCDIICMWNDLAPDHDWIVAVLRDVVTDDHFVCEYLASEDHHFLQVELFSSGAYSRIVNVLKNDDTPGVCHADRLEELAAAADAANAALGSRMKHHEGNWVRVELTALFRADVAQHGIVQPGTC